MSIAWDSDSDPNNHASPTRLESFYYRDYAEQTVDIHRRHLTAEHGEHALDGLVFGVRQVPREPRPTEGG